MSSLLSTTTEERLFTRAHPADARLVQVQALQRRSPSPQGSGDALRRPCSARSNKSWFLARSSLRRWFHLHAREASIPKSQLQCEIPWSSSRRYGRLADCSGAVPQISRRKTKKQQVVVLGEVFVAEMVPPARTRGKHSQKSTMTAEARARTPQTHDLFKCKRCKDGRQVLKAPAMLYGDTSTYSPRRGTG
jgi:hypothetical protein